MELSFCTHGGGVVLDVRFGLEKWLYYFREIAALPLAPQGGFDDAVEAITGSGLAVIGDPDDACAQLERLEQQSGGYGCFLLMDHNWADWERKKKSYELIARYVMPRFQGLNAPREASMKWAASGRRSDSSPAGRSSRPGRSRGCYFPASPHRGPRCRGTGSAARAPRTA